ncbi:MAG TPA: MFS transporter [Micromonosporaceae bacterium]
MAFRAQRIAIGVVFAVHGAVAGTFATRIPAISEHLHLSPGELGLALLMPGIGSVGLMPLTGRLIHRIGGKAATQVLLAAWCLALMLPSLAPNLGTLCAVLLVFGACAGTADVAMNAQGVAVEHLMGKSIMSSLHGLWSIGGFAAAGVGALVLRFNVAVLPHFAGVSLVLLVIGQLACLRLPTTAAPQPSEDEPKPARFALPRGPVLAIAVIGFCAVFPEVAGQDWAAVYLRRVLDSGHASAALGYTVFAAGMAICRLTGDRLIRRIGPVATVRIGALAGTVGAVVIVWAVNTPVTIVGFGLMGVGIAVVVPLAFAAAGRIGARKGSAQTGDAIAGVATIAYGAGLAAPGAIGGIASWTSLRASFILVALLVAIVAVGAGVLRVRDGDPTDDPTNDRQIDPVESLSL